MAKEMMTAKSDMDYKVEEGTRTLIRAEEIKQDKKLYALCQKEMTKRMSAMHRAMGEHTGESLKMALDKNKTGED
mgnify:CR=1 FL=1